MSDKKPNRPDPEVLETKPRRRFTAKYKLSILAEVDVCTKPGEIGALLRREGLYYSNIRTWQRQLQDGALKGLSPKKRGRKKHEANPLAKHVAELSHQTNTKAACAAFNIPRATYYRQTANLTVAKPTVRLASPPLALTLAEEQKVLDALHEPRFRDLAPHTVNKLFWLSVSSMTPVKNNKSNRTS